MGYRRLLLDELREVGLIDIDPERARGLDVVRAREFDVGSGELARLSVAVYFPDRGEGDNERNFKGDGDRARGDGDGERPFLIDGCLSLTVERTAD